MSHPLLKQWIFYDGEIIGDIYGHGDWEDGKTIRTNPVVDLVGNVIKTEIGSRYTLGHSYTHTLKDIEKYLNMTNTYDHQELVAKLVKSGEDTLSDLTPDKAVAVHMVMGISGEAGELLDAVKKWAIYTKPLDMENVIEELGDLEFFMEGLRSILGIPRESTLLHNYTKLSKRYNNGSYSNSAAIQRADKD